LLSEKSVFGEQLGASTEDIASQPDRIRGWAECFPDRSAHAAGSGSEGGGQRGEHDSISRGARTKNKAGSAAANSVVFEQVGLVLSVWGTGNTRASRAVVISITRARGEFWRDHPDSRGPVTIACGAPPVSRITD